MRRLAGCLILAGGVVLFSATTGTDERLLGGIGLALSALWLFNTLRLGPGATALFAGFVGVAAGAAAAGAGLLLPAASVTLALLGWDASLAAARLRDVPPDHRRRIAVHYGTSSGLVALACLGSIAAANSVHIRLRFGPAVGLAAVLLGLSLAIAALARPTTAADATTDESLDAGGTNEEAGQLTLPGPDETDSSWLSSTRSRAGHKSARKTSCRLRDR